MSLKQKQRVKKLSLVLANSTPVTAAKKKAVKIAKTVEIDKVDEDGECLETNLI